MSYKYGSLGCQCSLITDVFSMLKDLHRDDFTSDMKTKIDDARDEALGRHNERTAERPIYRDGTFTSRTAFERNNRAHGIHGTRCYTLVNSFEKQPLLAAPSATSKQSDSMWDASLLMRQNIVNVS